jgi:hypothetical protein
VLFGRGYAGCWMQTSENLSRLSTSVNKELREPATRVYDSRYKGKDG